MSLNAVATITRELKITGKLYAFNIHKYSIEMINSEILVL